MPVITFYEVNETATAPGTFPELAGAEGVIFDYISDQGAASQKGAFRIARNQGYTQAETVKALYNLRSKRLLTIRNLTVETDEVKRS